MPLETATFIDGLAPTNPAAGDLVSQGDDHLRLIKNVLKSTFPGLSMAVNIAPTATPQFGGIEIGHATDTTLQRASAGNLSIQGNLIYRAGGTDVPIADGGTGGSTAAAARTNLGLGTASTLSSPIPVANGGTAATTAASARSSLGVPAISGAAFTGLVSAPRFRTETLTVADDAVGVVDMQGFGVCHVVIETLSQNQRTLVPSGSLRIRCDSSAPINNNISLDESNVNRTTGDPAIVNQVDGKITLSAGSTNFRIYNRFGSALSFTVTIFG